MRSGPGETPWVKFLDDSSLNIVPFDLKTWGLKRHIIYPLPHYYPTYNAYVGKVLTIPKGGKQEAHRSHWSIVVLFLCFLYVIYSISIV